MLFNEVDLHHQMFLNQSLHLQLQCMSSHFRSMSIVLFLREEVEALLVDTEEVVAVGLDSGL